MALSSFSSSSSSISCILSPTQVPLWEICHSASLMDLLQFGVSLDKVPPEAGLAACTVADVGYGSIHILRGKLRARNVTLFDSSRDFVEERRTYSFDCKSFIIETEVVSALNTLSCFLKYGFRFYL